MVDGDPLSTSMAVLLLEPLDNLVDTFSVLVECVPEVSFHLDVERLVLVGSNGEDDVGLVLGLDGAASRPPLQLRNVCREIFFIF